MPNDNVLSAGAATAVWGIWSAIELAPFRRHRAIPSRDWDKGSLLALNVAHGFRLVGMLVGFLGVGRIDGADAPLQLSGLGLMFAGITIRWTAIYALGVFFTGRVQIRDGHTLIRTGIYSRLRHPAMGRQAWRLAKVLFDRDHRGAPRILTAEVTAATGLTSCAAVATACQASLSQWKKA
jgi:hypothetical protein